MDEEVLALSAGHTGQFRVICPACTHTRKAIHRRDTSLSCERTADGVRYTCWHCGASGFAKSNLTNVVPIRRDRRVTTPKAIISPKGLTPPVEAFLRKRGIDPDVARSYGCGADVRRFREVGESPALVLPYVNASGEVYSAKYRATIGKDFLARGSADTLFGSHLWGDKVSDLPILITEGEMDTLAVATSLLQHREGGVQAGIRVGSLPHGATAGVGTLDRKLRVLETHHAQFVAADRILIGVDQDEAGEACALEIARRVGRDKCWRIKWREKDANEVLLRHGAMAVLEDIEAAEAFPLDGLYSVDHYQDLIDQFIDDGFPPGISTGYDTLDELFTLAPGLYVVTGIPGSGKSNLIDQIIMNTILSHGLRWAICSWENPPYIHAVRLASKRAKVNPFKGFRYDKDRLRRAVALVKEHVHFLEDHGEAPPTIDSILSRFRAAVMRYGVRGLVVDPYNFLVRPRDMDEREFIEAMLVRLKTFALATGCSLFIVGHPTKMQRRDDGSYQVPGGYDISGSAGWFSKADVGFTVSRPDMRTPVVDVRCWKVRFEHIGRVGDATLFYNVDTSCYQENPEEPGPRFYEEDRDRREG